MNTLIIYFILCLAQLSIYFFLKNNIKNLKFFNYGNYSKLINNEVAEPTEASKTEINRPAILPNKVKNNDYIILNKSLKHLEFISRFEMYLEDESYKNFPIEFLQEFEKIKLEAQLSALKTTTKLNTGIKRAA